MHSKDGTTIAFSRSGEGPAIVLVDGAFASRRLGSSGDLASRLASQFTVVTYDRRGRGNSGDTAPYAIEREVEDIEALIEAAGGSAYVYGISSGAALALEAARRLPAITRLALYEAPFIVDDSRSPMPQGFLAHLNELLAADRRGDMVRLFMKLVGLPSIVVALMRFMPMWSKLEAAAHTLPYDIAIVEDNQRGKPLPAERWAPITAPALVIDGGKSPARMHNAMQALAEALPNAERRTLAGQTHNVKVKVLAPVLQEFFTAEAQPARGPVANEARRAASELQRA